MNLCMLVGRLTKDPEIHYSENNEMPVARFTLAVDRGRRVEGEANADFFRCVAFDKKADFVEQYLYSGMRIAVQGKMRNENYTSKDGTKVYGVSLLADQIEFADGKRDDGQAAAAGNGSTTGNSQQPAAGNRTATSTSSGRNTGSRQAASRQTAGAAPSGRSAAGRTVSGRTAARSAARTAARGDGFMNIPDGVEDEGLPFN